MATAAATFAALKQAAQNGFIELSLKEIGKAFTDLPDFFPDLAFDINQVKMLSVLENKFVISAHSKDFLFKKTIFKNESVDIEASFELVNDEIEMVAICRINKAVPHLSKLPGGIGPLLKPLDVIEVADMVYIITTHPVTKIVSTTFPQYNDRPVNLKPGINLAGFIGIGSSGAIGQAVTAVLKPVIGAGPYFMSWNMKDKLDVDFTFNIPQDIDLHGIFKIKEPKLVLKPVMPFRISIDGVLNLPLPVVKITLPGGFTFSPDGIEGRFNLDKAAGDIKAPFGYPGVHLLTLTATAGISNGIATLGAEGYFYIGKTKPQNPGGQAAGEFSMRTNQYKFKFDAIPGKITPKFCYLYLDKLTLEEYIKAISNQDVQLPSFLNKISIDQLMFHWCETPTGETKPDGTIAMPVLGFSGIANLFGYKVFAEMQSKTAGESEGKLVAAPINIGNGLLKITGEGKGTPEKYKGAVKVPAGGVDFAFNSKGTPAYLSFSAAIAVLGLSGGATGEFKDNGINAKLKSNVAGIIKNELEVVCQGQEFAASTLIDTRISGLEVSLGSIGKIKINAALQGEFSAAYKANQYSNSMRLAFELLGIKFDLGHITTQVQIKDLTKLVQQLEPMIRDLVVKTLTTDAWAFLQAAIGKVIEFAGKELEQVGKALNDTFKKTMQESAELMRKAGYEAAHVGVALKEGFNKAEQEVANALKAAKFLAEESGEALKQAYNMTGEAAAGILNKAGYTALEVGRTMSKIFGAAPEAVATALKGINATATDIADHLKNIGKKTADQVGNTLKQLQFSNEDIAKAMHAHFSDEETGHFFTKVLNLPVETARELLGKIGIKVDGVPSLSLPHIPIPHIPIPKPPHVFVKHFMKL